MVALPNGEQVRTPIEEAARQRYEAALAADKAAHPSKYKKVEPPEEEKKRIEAGIESWQIHKSAVVSDDIDGGQVFVISPAFTDCFGCSFGGNVLVINIVFDPGAQSFDLGPSVGLTRGDFSR